MLGDCGLLYWQGRVLAISALVQTMGVSLPLSPAQQVAGDAVLARLGEAVFRWTDQ